MIDRAETKTSVAEQSSSPVERSASDLHLKVGSYPVIRIDGTLIPMVDSKRLMQEDTVAMAYSIMNARQKQRFKEVSQELSSLTSRYSDKVLDATHAWTKLIDDVDALTGLPDSALDLAKQTAQQP